MASATKALEREIGDHEQFLDAVVAAAQAVKDSAQSWMELASKVEADAPDKNRKAAKQRQQLESQRDQAKDDYLAAAHNFAGLQARLNHMHAALIKLLTEFQSLSERVGKLPAKVEDASRSVHDLQATLVQLGALMKDVQQNGSPD